MMKTIPHSLDKNSDEEFSHRMRETFQFLIVKIKTQERSIKKNGYKTSFNSS